MRIKPPLSPFTRPPAALRKARLDNIALVPASLLPLKGTYQKLANTLPQGGVLCVQSTSPKHKRILAQVAAFLRTHSRQVLTLPVESIKTNGYHKKDAKVQSIYFAL